MPRKSTRKPSVRRRSRSVGPDDAASLLHLPPRLRLVRRQHTLIYGLRLIPDRVLAEGAHEQVKLTLAGEQESMTLHRIAGDKEEIRRRLLQSVDAFFDIFGEDLD
jgi:hypothetical protein